MPFTFTHPAIILPFTYLNRKWFSLTGLVIGSLTPDFEYFLRMKVKSNYSHTLWGMLWFDLPLGLLLAFIFHNLVRDNLFENSPTLFKSRLSKFRQFDWNYFLKKNWLIVLISLLIGITSHLFWDSFTHSSGYFVVKNSLLRYNINLLGNEIPVYKILQHGSSLIGGLIIAIAFNKLPVDKNITNKIKLNYWMSIAVLTFLIISIRIISGLKINQYGNIIVTAISAVIVSLILYSIGLVILKKIKTS